MPALLRDLRILYSSCVEPFRSHTYDILPRRRVQSRLRVGGRKWVTYQGDISVSVYLVEEK